MNPACGSAAPPGCWVRSPSQPVTQSLLLALVVVAD